jgi:hypothetical protein
MRRSDLLTLMRNDDDARVVHVRSPTGRRVSCGATTPPANVFCPRRSTDCRPETRLRLRPLFPLWPPCTPHSAPSARRDGVP